MSDEVKARERIAEIANKRESILADELFSRVYMPEIFDLIKTDIPFLLEQLSEAVRAERMECAKAVCGYCGELDNNLHPASRLDDGSWVHRSKLSERVFDCEATPIHERAAIWSLPKGEL